MAFFVYQLTFPTLGQCYVGRTKNVERRVIKHRGERKWPFDEGYHLAVLSEHATLAEAAAAEEEAILRLECFAPYGLNVMLGRKTAPETRAKMRAAHARLRTWAGRKHTPEARAKMSAAKKALVAQGWGQKRRPLSAQTKAKISAAKHGRVPWNKGIPRTEAEKDAIRAGQRRG